MNETSTPVSGEDRRRRIEARLVVEPPVWSGEEQVGTIQERMAYHQTPGLSLAVIHGGRIAWTRGYGVLEAGRAAPVTPDTIFQACSISKHVAMAGVLRLVAEGVLDLDEDVNRYLTSWQLPPNGPWHPRVTLRHLLGHTAGLVYTWYRGFRRGAAIPTLHDVLEGRPPANTPPVRVVLLPGTRFRYSGSHYAVIQQVLVDATGTPFPALMRRLVFAPLGMDHSSYDQAYPDERPGAAAVGHYLGGMPVDGKWRVLPEMAGAGLWTTPTDLARLALEIQRAQAGLPTACLPPSLVDQALTPVIDEGFGLGTQLEGDGPARRYGHAGSNIGYTCLATAYVEHGMGAVAMTNGEDGIWVVLELFKAIAREYGWPAYEPRRTAVPVDQEVDAAYVGAYAPERGPALAVTHAAGGLHLVVAGQAPIALEARSAAEYFTRATNTDVVFSRNEVGEVTHLTLKQEGQETAAQRQP
jgi:CubicO group peptidase (beta-lactamase class C family)